MIFFYLSQLFVCASDDNSVGPLCIKLHNSVSSTFSISLLSWSNPSFNPPNQRAHVFVHTPFTNIVTRPYKCGSRALSTQASPCFVVPGRHSDTHNPFDVNLPDAHSKHVSRRIMRAASSSLAGIIDSTVVQGTHFTPCNVNVSLTYFNCSSSSLSFPPLHSTSVNAISCGAPNPAGQYSHWSADLSPVLLVHLPAAHNVHWSSEVRPVFANATETCTLLKIEEYSKSSSSIN